MSWFRFAPAGLGAAVLCSLAVATSGRAEADKPAAVRIGVIQSLFRGQEPTALLAASAPLSELVNIQTGIRAQFTVVKDGADMAKRLKEDDLQLGVLHGIEYAWIKDKHPELQPLVLPYNQTIKLKSYLLVRNDCEAKCLEDLKGKTLALPKKTLNHCHLFLHKSIQETGGNPSAYFGPSASPASIEDAIEAVIEGAAVMTVVDGVALDTYKSRKPGRAAKLKVLKESCVFPTAAIIYKPTDANKEMAKKFHDGMITAHEKVMGRQLLTLWRLTNFGTVTPEYPQMLKDILKDYPEPMHPASFCAETKAENQGDK